MRGGGEQRRLEKNIPDTRRVGTDDEDDDIILIECPNCGSLHAPPPCPK